MIHEEDPGAINEPTAAVDEDNFEAVYGEAPPIDDNRLSTRPGVVSGAP